MWTRKDTFEAMKAGETMPGRLQWSVGYFTKVRLMDSQVAYKRKFTILNCAFLVYKHYLPHLRTQSMWCCCHSRSTSSMSHSC